MQQHPVSSSVGQDWVWNVAKVAGAAGLLAAHLVVFLPSALLFERSNILATKSYFQPEQVKRRLRLAWPKWRRNKEEEVIITKIQFGIKELKALHASESLQTLAEMSAKGLVSDVARQMTSAVLYNRALWAHKWYQRHHGLPEITPPEHLLTRFTFISDAAAAALTFPVYVWAFKARHHIPSTFYDITMFESGALPLAVSLSVLQSSAGNALVNFYLKAYYGPFYYFLNREIKSLDKSTWRSVIGISLYRAAARFSASATLSLVTAPVHAVLVKLLVWEGGRGGINALTDCVLKTYQKGGIYGFYEGFGWYLVQSAVEAGLESLLLPQRDHHAGYLPA